MWTREGIKTYAKDFLRKYYSKAFIVCLIFTILSGNHFRESNSTRREFDINNPNPTFDQYLEEGSKVPLETNYEGLNFFLRKIGLIPLAYISWTLFAIFLFTFIIIWITIGSLLKVGKNRFFLKGFKGDVNIRYLFSTFNKNEFWGIVRCMVETAIYNFFWFILLIIPGIIKIYEYRFVPYLLTENPNLTYSEAISRSKEMTKGQKMDMFVLDLSFLGWQLLGMLFLGIGGIFVVPYYEASIAKLYNVLSGNDDIPEVILD